MAEPDFGALIGRHLPDDEMEKHLAEHVKRGVLKSYEHDLFWYVVQADGTSVTFFNTEDLGNFLIGIGACLLWIVLLLEARGLR